jgi:hypothetical protein
MSIDAVIPGHRNVIRREAKKILKCEDLKAQIQRMWNVTTKVIPVITGATGTVSKSLRQYLSNIPRSTKLRNCRQQPYCALHTDCGKC